MLSLVLDKRFPGPEKSEIAQLPTYDRQVLMPVEVAAFHVAARPHPEHDKDNMQWLVRIAVRFRSEDPANWGELRAYGGSWFRKINRTVEKSGIRESSLSQVLDPSTIEDLDVCVTAVRNLPPWPGYRPTADREMMNKDLRLGNDQHIEAFYAKRVPGVPRSWPETVDMVKEPKYLDYDPITDAMGYDDPRHTDRPSEIDLRSWHIFGRDEPQRANWLEEGDYCEYYHAAEFHIRPPGSVEVIARRKLLLIIKGYYGKLKYLSPIID